MNIVLISSVGHCGIREYSLILKAGFEQLGHRIRYLGVEQHNNHDLAAQIRTVASNDDLIIFEYEPGIFWLGGLIRAMAWLRYARHKRVLLSVHEIAPEKYAEYRQIQWHLSRFLTRPLGRELLWLVLAALDVVVRFLLLRLGLMALGQIPHEIVVHSLKAAENIRLAVSNNDRVRSIPHVVKPLIGERDLLRRELELPVEPFAFISPGFLFRRKRIIDVIAQLPAGTELWVVGTESVHDPGYLDELRAKALECGNQARVRLITDQYDRLEQYIMAADAGVFYYADGYQSGVASLAVGAGKPCIFSDLPAFTDLREAGIVVKTPVELHQALEKIQQPDVYAQLRNQAGKILAQYSPAKIAGLYLQALKQQ